MAAGPGGAGGKKLLGSELGGMWGLGAEGELPSGELGRGAGRRWKRGLWLSGWKQGCAGEGEEGDAAGAVFGSSPCSPMAWGGCRGSSPAERAFSGSAGGGGLGAGGVKPRLEWEL